MLDITSFKHTKKTNMNLEQAWLQLFSPYAAHEESISALWARVRKQYEEKHRFYHNLTHISQLLKQYETHQNLLEDAVSVQLAIWFHDVVYDPFSKNNEEKSAEFAQKKLTSFDFLPQSLEKMNTLILATQKHQPISNSFDELFFLDCDLCILGQDEAMYKIYAQQIRAEYKNVPNFLYQSGRIEVLNKFLARERIFFTDLFFAQFEKQARENIKNELILLQ